MNCDFINISFTSRQTLAHSMWDQETDPNKLSIFINKTKHCKLIGILVHEGQLIILARNHFINLACFSSQLLCRHIHETERMYKSNKTFWLKLFDELLPADSRINLFLALTLTTPFFYFCVERVNTWSKVHAVMYMYYFIWKSAFHAYSTVLMTCSGSWKS